MHEHQATVMSTSAVNMPSQVISLVLWFVYRCWRSKISVNPYACLQPKALGAKVGNACKGDMVLLCRCNAILRDYLLISATSSRPRNVDLHVDSCPPKMLKWRQPCCFHRRAWHCSGGHRSWVCTLYHVIERTLQYTVCLIGSYWC